MQLPGLMLGLSFFWFDNEAVVQVVIAQTFRSFRVMRLVHCFMLHCLKFNIVFSARWI